MRLNKRLATVLIVIGLLIAGLMAGVVLASGPDSAAGASAACVDDDVAGEVETEAGEASEVEDADCPGDDEDSSHSAAGASAQTTCVDDDVAGEAESEADEASEVEDADCPGDDEDDGG